MSRTSVFFDKKCCGLFYCCVFFLLSVLPIYSQNNLPNTQETLHNAEELLRSGDFKKAQIAFKQILLHDPASTKAMKGLGKIALAREDWPKVREWFLKTLEVTPRDQEASDYWQNKYIVHDVLDQGDSLFTAGDLKAAKKTYKEARKLDKGYSEIYKRFAKIAFEKKKWRDFNKNLNKGLKLNPDDTELQQMFETNPEFIRLLKAGDDAYQAGNLEQAYETFEEAATINKGSRYLYRRLGQTAFGLHDWQNVKDWYHKLMDLNLKDDLEANYCRGIAFRETAKYNANLLKRLGMGRSRKSFRTVMAIDSLYEDVYYQAALTEKEQGRWYEMMRLAHRQLELKPGLSNVNVGLLYFYRILLREKNTTQLDSLFKVIGSPDWAAYISGIRFRREKQYARADSVFHRLLENEQAISRTAIYLSLLRNELAKGAGESAHAYFQDAINSIQTETDATFMLAETKYVFTDNELDFYEDLETPELKRAFYLSFWNARNPIPASPINNRVLEHFTRLNAAEEEYWYPSIRLDRDNPDKAQQLSFPKAYALNDRFNDKGLIYIRHGEPDKVARTSSQLTTNESWLYNANHVRPKMIFHFTLDERLGTGNSWRLTPYLTDVALLEDRLGWDPKMDRLYLALKPNPNAMIATRVRGRTQEAYQIESEIADASREVVALALSTDTHSRDKRRKDMPMFFFAHSRRGKKDKTHVEIFTATPVRSWFPDKNEPVEQVKFEHGAGIFNKFWGRVEQVSEKSNLNPADSDQIYHGFFIEKYDFHLDPEKYHISIYARDEEEIRVADRTVSVDIPDLSGPGLKMSDLLIAFDISASKDNPRFRRGQLTAIPNPGRVFKLSEAISVLFEVYGLTKDNDGDSRYRIKTELTSLKKTKGVLNLFSKNSKKSISLQNDLIGKTSTTSEFINLNVAKLKPGIYALAIQVTDLLNEQSQEKSIEVKLID